MTIHAGVYPVKHLHHKQSIRPSSDETTLDVDNNIAPRDRPVDIQVRPHLLTFHVRLISVIPPC